MEISCAKVFNDAAGSSGRLWLGRMLGRRVFVLVVVVLRWTCGRFKRKRMRENKNHVCENRNGTVLLSINRGDQWHHRVLYVSEYARERLPPESP